MSDALARMIAEDVERFGEDFVRRFDEVRMPAAELASRPTMPFPEPTGPEDFD